MPSDRYYVALALVIYNPPRDPNNLQRPSSELFTSKRGQRPRPHPSPRCTVCSCSNHNRRTPADHTPNVLGDQLRDKKQKRITADATKERQWWGSTGVRAHEITLSNPLQQRSGFTASEARQIPLLCPDIAVRCSEPAHQTSLPFRLHDSGYCLLQSGRRHQLPGRCLDFKLVIPAQSRQLSPEAPLPSRSQCRC